MKQLSTIGLFLLKTSIGENKKLKKKKKLQKRLVTCLHLLFNELGFYWKEFFKKKIRQQYEVFTVPQKPKDTECQKMSKIETLAILSSIY